VSRRVEEWGVAMLAVEQTSASPEKVFDAGSAGFAATQICQYGLIDGDPHRERTLFISRIEIVDLEVKAERALVLLGLDLMELYDAVQICGLILALVFGFGLVVAEGAHSEGAGGKSGVHGSVGSADLVRRDVDSCLPIFFQGLVTACMLRRSRSVARVWRMERIPLHRSADPRPRCSPWPLLLFRPDRPSDPRPHATHDDASVAAVECMAVAAVECMAVAAVECVECMAVAAAECMHA
jgi:hypothetical protein